jgi:hypothetical protein
VSMNNKTLRMMFARDLREQHYVLPEIRPSMRK